MSSPQHALYLPRMLLDWLRHEPEVTHKLLHGTAMFADVSGFTALTEQLAKEQGKGGAEAITRIMNDAFAELVEIVFLEGGDLLRYGGDALFCFFEGSDHAGRAARAAIDMTKEITEIDAGSVELGISIGVAAGEMEVMIVGETEREMFFRGAAVDDCMAAESAADSGQVFAPPPLAELIPGADVAPAGDFISIVEDDPDTPFGDGAPDVQLPEDQDYSAFISSDLRERLTLALVGGEHRPASIGFVMYRDEIDMSAEDRVAAMDDLFAHFRAVCDRHHVAFLQNDVYPEGGKFLIADGVPQRSSGSEGVAAALHDIVNWDGPFALRGGCARGYVFAGDLGAPNRRAYTVMADTANLAARLGSRAPDGGVLITEAALERSRGDFTTERGEALELKGKSMAVRPFLILDVEESHEAEAEIPLFGREGEVTTLRNVLARGVAGGSGVASLSAAVGLGKSLLAEVAAADLGRTIAVRSGGEVARGAGFTARLLEQVFEIDPGSDTVEELTGLAGRSSRTDADDLALIERAFGIEGEEDDIVSAEQVAGQLGRTVADLLLDTAADQRLVFRFENSGAAGPAARAVIADIARVSEQTNWAVVVLSEKPIEWLLGDLHIMLEPFDEPASHAFVRFLLGDSVLPAQVIDEILERGLGNPYVLQELTNSVLAGGKVPESIEAAAVAKMDRLDPRDEQLLCLASVLGNEARIELLTAVLPDPALAEDASSWARLQDFVDTSTVGKIRFRDPVLRDAAYGMLPHRRRQEAHARVAETIEQRARRRPERFAGELAYHFHRAEAWDKSWNYSQMAAATASRRLDFYSSVQNWRQALEAAEHLGEEPEGLAAAFRGLGDAAEGAALYEDAVEAFERARSLEPEGSGAAGQLDHKVGMSLIRLGRPDEARERLQRAIDESERTDDKGTRLAAMAGIAGLEIRRGHADEAGEWSDKVIAEGDEENDSATVANAYYIRSLVSSRQGRASASAEAEKALEIFVRLNDTVGAGYARNNLAYSAFSVGAWDKCEDYHLANRESLRESGEVLGLALNGYNLGELYLEQGRYVEAQPLLEKTLTDFRGAGHQVGEAATRLTLARLWTRLSKVEEAEQEFQRALELAADADAADQTAEANLGLIELALSCGDGNRAMSVLEQLDPDLSGPSLVRRHILEAAAAAMLGRSDRAQEAIMSAVTESHEAGAKHLEFAAAEMAGRLTGSGSDEADALSQQLGMVARPVYRLTSA